MTIHPKTSGASLGGALGVMLVSVLASIHGVHLTDEANAAIPAFLAALGAFLSPSPPNGAVAHQWTVPPTVQAPAVLPQPPNQPPGNTTVVPPVNT